ncbi:S26 family signal peptidase, partial [Pseudomonas aeruginosa]
MTVKTTRANMPAVAPRPRSRLRARIVVTTLAAIGFAALAWAAFVSPLPRLTYNPSDSVAVGWYRIEPFDPR